LYKIQIKKQALKQLNKLPLEAIIDINSAISQLSFNPKPFSSKKLNHPDELYRIRIGIYRVIYLIIENELVIEVIKIAHRKESYRNI
jgi:mRNA interferase RelE/StbE